MSAPDHDQRARDISREIARWQDPNDGATTLLGGIALFLVERHGPRAAAETFYQFADAIAVKATREWRL